MTDPGTGERQSRQSWRALFASGRMTGLLLVGLGVLLLVSGATGHDALSRLYKHGVVSFNDAIPGAMFLAIGLFFVRMAGGAPLLDQVRELRLWDRRRWISVALTTIGVLGGLFVAAVHPLLRPTPWLLYTLSGTASLVILIGASLWPKRQNGPAQS